MERRVAATEAYRGISAASASREQTYLVGFQEARIRIHDAVFSKVPTRGQGTDKAGRKHFMAADPDSPEC
jgi:hypothetical protein